MSPLYSLQTPVLNGDGLSTGDAAYYRPITNVVHFQDYSVDSGKSTQGPTQKDLSSHCFYR